MSNIIGCSLLSMILTKPTEFLFSSTRRCWGGHDDCEYDNEHFKFLHRRHLETEMGYSIHALYRLAQRSTRHIH